MLCVQPGQRLLWSVLTTVFALCYGLVFVIPIGGADMPVVISVLNACTGTAVAMSGLAINNIALIVAGALVGAAGVTLSIAMSKAMNRPLLSVLAGGFGGANAAAGAGEGPEGSMKETSADDLPYSSYTPKRSSSCRASVWPRLRPSASLLILVCSSRTTASKSPTPSIRWQAVCLVT